MSSVSSYVSNTALTQPNSATTASVVGSHGTTTFSTTSPFSSLEPAAPSSAAMGAVLNSPVGDMLGWIGEKLTNIATEIFPSPSVSERRNAMYANHKALQALFQETIWNDEVTEQDFFPILQDYLRHAAALVKQNELTPEEWQAELNDLKEQAAKRSQEANINLEGMETALNAWIEHLTEYMEYLEKTSKESAPAHSTVQTTVPTPTPPVSINIADLGNGTATTITTNISNAELGYSVAAIPDLNGDSIPELALTSIEAAVGGNAYAGQTSIVFGVEGDLPPTSDVSNLTGSNGFNVVNSASQTYSYFGFPTVGLGRVSDGADNALAFGSYGTNHFSGEVSVVYVPKTGTYPAIVDVAFLNEPNGPKGVTFVPDQKGGWFGAAIDGTDINGDSLPDIVIGAPQYNGGKGAAFVIFGQPYFPPVFNVSLLDGTNGFRVIKTDGSPVYLGHAVAGKGDANGDGFQDPIFCAYGENTCYGIFGKKDGFLPIYDLSKPLSAGTGFSVTRAGDKSRFGYSASYVGKIDGSPFDAFAVGAPYAGNSSDASTIGAGEVDVFFGQDSFPNTDAADLNGFNGFRMIGQLASGQVGYAVAGGGNNVANSGYPGVIVGGYKQFVYVIPGHQPPFFPNGNGTTVLYEVGTDGVVTFYSTGGEALGLGRAVAMVGNTAVIGAPTANGNEGEALVISNAAYTAPLADKKAPSREDRPNYRYGFYSTPVKSEESQNQDAPLPRSAL